MARPRPRPPKRRVIEIWSLLESVEDFADLFRLDPNTSIGDSDFNLLRRRINGFDNDTRRSPE